MVLVCEDGGHACIVELDVFVMDSDEVDRRMGSHERCESIRDNL